MIEVQKEMNLFVLLFLGKMKSIKNGGKQYEKNMGFIMDLQ